MNGPQVTLLSGRSRLHLNHGPIDLVVGAEGPGRAEAFDQAATRFSSVLQELVDELPALRSPNPGPVRGTIAQRMANATAPFQAQFITPMAAVAGAVADEILTSMQGLGLDKAFVNNGGDISLFLSAEQKMRIAVASAVETEMTLTSRMGIGGVASSGWRGRSYSLGIADTVTVLAKSAALADAAATLIANAVDLPGHPEILRAAADTLDSDSDLGEQLVTTGVGALAAKDLQMALGHGAKRAQAYLEQGLIEAAFLTLQGDHLSLSNLSQNIPLKEAEDA